MIKFEIQNEEKERRKRQYEREWHLYMDELSLLQDKLNTFKQRKANTNDSIEEQLHFIQVKKFLYQSFSIENFILDSKSRIRSISR